MSASQLFWFTKFATMTYAGDQIAVFLKGGKFFYEHGIVFAVDVEGGSAAYGVCQDSTFYRLQSSQGFVGVWHKKQLPDESALRDIAADNQRLELSRDKNQKARDTRIAKQRLTANGWEITKKKKEKKCSSGVS